MGWARGLRLLAIGVGSLLDLSGQGTYDALRRERRHLVKGRRASGGKR